ncbi:MAG: serine/threonine protein kinase [Myxococcaceae bacterium]|nr:serine/threonine protein kinase [Myxococcaceae bacterium]
MGVVYAAEHLRLKRAVAIKLVRSELASDRELLLRFEREAFTTGQLDHPHIAGAIDFGPLEGGGAFMVMPLVRGTSLQALLSARAGLHVRRVASIGAQIADALSAAHAVGVVHRDLKPANVLLEQRSDGGESVKVLDFGIATSAAHADPQSQHARALTQPGTILGTPGYMSPEQASAGKVDQRTDLYALGVILWELCRGERLFDGETITQIFAKQYTTCPPALTSRWSSGARELSSLIGSLLAWDQEARPASATAVRDALRQIGTSPDGSRLHTAFAHVRSLALHRWQIFACCVGLTAALALAFALLPDERQAAPIATPALRATISAERLTAPAQPPAPTKQEPEPQDRPMPVLAAEERASPVRARVLPSLLTVARQAASTLLEQSSQELRRRRPKRSSSSRRLSTSHR